jgi:hypothetical protein
MTVSSFALVTTGLHRSAIGPIRAWHIAVTAQFARGGTEALPEQARECRVAFEADCERDFGNPSVLDVSSVRGGGAGRPGMRAAFPRRRRETRG